MWPKCGQGSQATTSARSSADCQGEVDNPDEASSSRSQRAMRTASAAARLARDAPSVGPRWRPPLAVAIVTYLVTQSLPLTFCFSGVADAQVTLNRARVTGSLRLCWGVDGCSRCRQRRNGLTLLFRLNTWAQVPLSPGQAGGPPVGPGARLPSRFSGRSSDRRRMTSRVTSCVWRGSTKIATS